MSVTFHNLNHTWSRIDCDRSTFMDLQEEFVITPAGARHSPLFKKKIWDGKIRMLKNDGRIHTGLEHRVFEYCQKNNIEYNFQNNHNEQITREYVKQFTEEWNPMRLNEYEESVPLTPYNEQLEALYISLRYKRSLIVSPTASGKSYIIVTLMRKLLDQGKRILICVPFADLVSQLQDNMNEYYGHYYDFGDSFEYIQGGSTEISGDKRVTIGIWNSLIKNKANKFKDYDVVLYDEVHRAKGKSSIKILEACSNAEYKIGFTGSLKDSKLDQMTLEGLFGKPRVVQTLKEAAQDDKIAQSNVVIVKTQYNINNKKKLHSQAIDYFAQKAQVDKGQKKKIEGVSHKLNNEVNFISEYHPRNVLICKLALKCEQTTLVLFRLKKHGKDIYNLMKTMTDKEVFYVDSTVKTKERRRIRKYANKNNVILVCSFGTFSTGINIANIFNIIMTSPFRSSITLLQSLGRGLRKKIKDASLTVFDIIDDLNVDSYRSKTVEHGVARLQIYKDAEFNISFKKINLDI